MPTSTSLWRGAFFFLSYFSCSILQVSAQGSGMQNATTVVSSTQSTTTQTTNAVDGDVQTAAVLRPVVVGALAQEADERIQFAKTVPPGLGDSYMYLQVNKLASPTLGNTIDASIFNTSTITAFLNGNRVGSWSLGKILSVTLLREAQTVKLKVTPPAEYNQLEVHVDGAVSGYSVNMYEAFAPVPPAPLPVQLVSFQAKPSAAGVRLSWTTASELNNQHFTVERASGLAANAFVPLGQVAGAGTSSQAHSYQFTDATATGLGYYRLRQVDASGTECFSAVVAVQAAAPALLAAYPSPATTSLTVASATGTNLRIFNQQGQLVRQATLPAGAHTLDVSALAAGFYLLQDPESGQRLRIQKVN